jgi:hypothetical protein
MAHARMRVYLQGNRVKTAFGNFEGDKNAHVADFGRIENCAYLTNGFVFLKLRNSIENVLFGYAEFVGNGGKRPNNKRKIELKRVKYAFVK